MSHNKVSGSKNKQTLKRLKDISYRKKEAAEAESTPEGQKAAPSFAGPYGGIVTAWQGGGDLGSGV